MNMMINAVIPAVFYVPDEIVSYWEDSSLIIHSNNRDCLIATIDSVKQQAVILHI